jgi:hypothetical protein
MTATEQEKKEIETYYKRREQEQKKSFINHYVLKPVLLQGLHYARSVILEYGLKVDKPNVINIRKIITEEIKTEPNLQPHLIDAAEAFTETLSIIMNNDDKYEKMLIRICKRIAKEVN